MEGGGPVGTDTGDHICWRGGLYNRVHGSHLYICFGLAGVEVFCHDLRLPPSDNMVLKAISHPKLTFVLVSVMSTT